MAKSKHRKNHKEKLNKFKEKRKIEQEVFKKKMIDHYIKMQQQSLASKEDHTSTQIADDVDIDIDELTNVENVEFESTTVDNDFLIETDISLDIENLDNVEDLGNIDNNDVKS